MRFKLKMMIVLWILVLLPVIGIPLSARDIARKSSIRSAPRVQAMVLNKRTEEVKHWLTVRCERAKEQEVHVTKDRLESVSLGSTIELALMSDGTLASVDQLNLGIEYAMLALEIALGIGAGVGLYYLHRKSRAEGAFVRR